MSYNWQFFSGKMKAYYSRTNKKQFMTPFNKSTLGQRHSEGQETCMACSHNKTTAGVWMCCSHAKSQQWTTPISIVIIATKLLNLIQSALFCCCRVFSLPCDGFLELPDIHRNVEKSLSWLHCVLDRRQLWQLYHEMTVS